jgi:nitrogen regulatory protein PII
MKVILTFIPPHRLDRVTRALEHVANFPGMSVSDARGFGREKLDRPQGARDQLEDFTEAVRIECVIPDAMTDEVIEAVRSATHTGGRGDGKLFVLPVLEGLRIKTGERGPDVA